MNFLSVNYISQNKTNIEEGKLRCEELHEYLGKMNAPRDVWLSEDGSGIEPKACYDSRTDQIVGLVLPMEKETGMPIPYSYIPSSLKDMEDQMMLPKSTHLYTVMAQPAKENVPPFMLQLFGTDSKFKSEHVQKRWEYTKEELKK